MESFDEEKMGFLTNKVGIYVNQIEDILPGLAKVSEEGFILDALYKNTLLNINELLGGLTKIYEAQITPQEKKKWLNQHFKNTMGFFIRKLRNELKYNISSWSVMERVDQSLKILWESGLTEGEKKVQLKLGEGLAGTAAKNGAIIISDDIANDVRFIYIDLTPSFASLVCVPIMHTEEKTEEKTEEETEEKTVLGIINIGGKYKKEFCDGPKFRLIVTGMAKALSTELCIIKLYELLTKEEII